MYLTMAFHIIDILTLGYLQVVYSEIVVIYMVLQPRTIEKSLRKVTFSSTSLKPEKKREGKTHMGISK